MNREELMEVWKQTNTEKDKAALEHALYEDAIRSGTAPAGMHDSADVIFTIVGDKSCEPRRHLYNAGPWVQALWTEVDDHQMPIFTAVRLMRDARAEYKKGVPLVVALGEILREYHTWPSRRVKTRSGYRVVRQEPKGVKAAKGPKAEPPLTPEELEGDFWRKIRGLIRVQLDDTLVEADGPRKDEIRREFESELDGLLKRLQSRIRGEHNGLKMAVRVRPIDLAAACELLSLDVPARGKSIDPTLASRRRRSALKVLHPDVAGPGREVEFQAVNDAYEVILRYNEQVIPPRHESSETQTTGG